MTRTPEAAAAGLLRFTWEENGEIPLPVDAVRIATELGLRVFDADLDPNVSGTISKAPGSDAIILLARGDSVQRKRYTCAHELGHYDQHASDGTEDYAYSENRTALAGPGQPPAEKYANQFAAAFLMPEDLVKRYAADGSLTVLEMAQIFGVSAEAMHWRMKNLGVI